MTLLPSQLSRLASSTRCLLKPAKRIQEEEAEASLPWWGPEDRVGGAAVANAELGQHLYLGRG